VNNHATKSVKNNYVISGGYGYGCIGRLRLKFGRRPP
jgi:hypothetical protein